MKTDFKKTFKDYKCKKNNFALIELPPRNYLMVDGKGDPNKSQEFRLAIESLYPVAYKLKFASKIDLKKDYVVMPLEGLWWSKNMSAFTSARDKSKWDWTLMIYQPDWITKDMFREAVKKASQKNPPKFIDKVRFETLKEGLCVQTLHVGSFDDEGEILAKLHNEFVPENRLKLTGKHHEIYLSDFRKVAPEKLRTILRQPVFRVKNS